MESLSGNQIKDLKNLYSSIYLTEEESAEKVEKKEKQEPIIINLPNGGTKKIYPASDEYKRIKSGELTTSKSDSSMIPDVTNIKKNEKGDFSGTVEKPTVSAMGKDVNKIEKETQKDLKDKTQKVKVEKPLLSKPIKAKTDLGSDIRQVKPSSARDKMIARNEIKLGDDRVNLLRRQNADFQAMKKGDITKQQFIDKYPNSQTAKKFKLSKLNMSYEPYDLVLNYVLSEGHADTVEEAHYVMTQMDADTIQTIVKEQGVFKSNVLNKKYPDQPEMTEKGKETLPNLPDPKINGKDYNKIFGIGSSSQKALERLKK